MEHLVNFANLRFLAAHFMRSLAWLRSVALTGVACLALYFYSLPQPLVTVVYWNVSYMVLNARRIGWLMRRRRAPQA
jgi:hypothetical protein